MKVIVSHDVDHITCFEHRKDLILPKFFIRNMLETLNGTIAFREMMLRSAVVFSNQWQRIGEVMEFDRKQGIPSTFFLGVNNGKMLAYSLENAAYWIRRIHENGFDVGVHGIDYATPEGVKKEFDTFRQILPGVDFGIRMHYLRRNEATLGYMEAAGYMFDSSVRMPEGPFRNGNLWEFPLHIMDGDMINQGKRYGSKSLVQVQDFTRREIDKVYRKNIPYLTLLFHDRYFHPGFSLWKAWYEWVLSWCIENGFTFTSYSSAIRDLESGISN
jgi:peptidoglycan/xylan/chitin deacetylase (PgdA/CDA1 family)